MIFVVFIENTRESNKAIVHIYNFMALDMNDNTFDISNQNNNIHTFLRLSLHFSINAFDNRYKHC